MGTKETKFTSDECQALLDYIGKIYPITDWQPILTDEEKTVFEKLKKAGEFYIPTPKQNKGEKDGV